MKFEKGRNKVVSEMVASLFNRSVMFESEECGR